MRYHLEILKDLEDYFKKNTLNIESAELKYQIMSAATGGELLNRVGGWLLQYRKNHAISNELGTLINEFIDYCHHNNCRFHTWLY